MAHGAPYESLVLEPARLVGGLEEDAAASPLVGAKWYVAREAGGGIEYTFTAGALASARFLSADLLLDGSQMGVFKLTLREGADGPAFRLIYAALNQCSARIRVRLDAVDQNRWRYDREGAWLKPLCGGGRVDLARVDRMTISAERKGDEPLRWCQTAVKATAEEPPKLEDLVMPRGPILDRFGQSAIHSWPGKTRSEEKLIGRLEGQLERSSEQKWPEGWSRWGGWRGTQFEATGRFRTHNDGRRWWLIDPDGYLFWSAGMDCVRSAIDSCPEGIEKALEWLPPPEGEFASARRHRRGADFLIANLIRAFGPSDWRRSWAKIALAELRRYGFNTVANWSDWEFAREAGFPYVRPLDLEFVARSKSIFRDFPDVFHGDFELDAADFARQLEDTRDDPAMIGYFLMNEPTWGFAAIVPAEGVLFSSPDSETRRALGRFLRERYATDEALSAAWGIPTTLNALSGGEWKTPLSDAARRDLEEFSTAMVRKLFNTLSAACKRVDPHHLNLGARYHTVPPDWALPGMDSFDVFSINCYRERVPAEPLRKIAATVGRPTMIGEWHFGALDVGLPASGIGRVRTQADRGLAFRVYTETAAEIPECVGVHYFTLYDQSPIGRFDGENYNIGFLDVCHRPYDELVRAARASHERVYRVALGETPPWVEPVEYLPHLFV